MAGEEDKKEAERKRAEEEKRNQEEISKNNEAKPKIEEPKTMEPEKKKEAEPEDRMDKVSFLKGWEATEGDDPLVALMKEMLAAMMERGTAMKAGLRDQVLEVIKKTSDVATRLQGEVTDKIDLNKAQKILGLKRDATLEDAEKATKSRVSQIDEEINTNKKIIDNLGEIQDKIRNKYKGGVADHGIDKIREKQKELEDLSQQQTDLKGKIQGLQQERNKVIDANNLIQKMDAKQTIGLNHNSTPENDKKKTDVPVENLDEETNDLIETLQTAPTTVNPNDLNDIEMEELGTSKDHVEDTQNTLESTNTNELN